MPSRRTLGTLLRHLIEHLDGSVERRYRSAGLAYRPRYTPVFRALLHLQKASLREISEYAGTTHSAVSQTVAQMRKAGLIESAKGTDGREHVVRLSAKANRMLPELQSVWAATNAAAEKLDAELPFPLSSLLDRAIVALERQPFEERIRTIQIESRRTP